MDEGKIEFHNHLEGSLYPEAWLYQLEIFLSSETYMICSGGIWPEQLKFYKNQNRDTKNYYLNKYKFLQTWRRILG